MSPRMLAWIDHWTTQYITGSSYCSWDSQRPTGLVGLLLHPAARNHSLLSRSATALAPEISPPNLLMAVSHQKQFSLSWHLDYVPEGEEVLNLPSAKIYKLFVNSTHWLGHNESRMLEKMGRFDAELLQAQILLTNLGKLPRLPDFVSIRFFQFLFNASATGRRLAWGGEGAHVGADTPCFFCKDAREGSGDKSLDSWEHMLSDCLMGAYAL